MTKTLDELRAETKAAEVAGSVYSDDFRAWYAAYPRKRAPGDAWKAWKTAVRRPPVAAMLAALQAQIRSREWQDIRFIPYPARYLRGRRWEEATTSPGDTGGPLRGVPIGGNVLPGRVAGAVRRSEPIPVRDLVDQVERKLVGPPPPGLFDRTPGGRIKVP